ncbi:ribonuclease III [Vicingaceae bacterium]|nr:ribonuclease III [Vicingaceae bacterium]
MSLFRGIKYFLLSDNSKQKTLRQILGFYPRNFSLYDQAFTHKSIVNDGKDNDKVSNERLEFLGDAILGSIVAEYFFQKFPYEDEGFLTKIRSKLVSRDFLNQLSVDIGLDTFLETSVNLYRSKSIFGDAFEALIGAIYLDKGYEQCKKFVVNKIIKDYVDVDELLATETNFKSKLIEYSQSKKMNYKFQTIAVETESIKFFKCELFIGTGEAIVGEGNSKKRAEQEAARLFFEKF